MIRTTNVTVTASCDGYFCDRAITASGTSQAHANAGLRAQGWTIAKQRIFCPPCHADRRRLIRDGVLSRDGELVRDAAAYDRFLDSRAPWAREPSTTR